MQAKTFLEWTHYLKYIIKKFSRMINKKKLQIVNVNQFGYSVGHYYYCKYLLDKYDIEYICFDKGRKKMKLNGVKVWYVSSKLNKIKRFFHFVVTVIKINREVNPDVLWVVYFKLCFLLSFICKSKIKILDIRTGSLAKNKFKRKFNNIILYYQSLSYKKNIILSEGLRNLLGVSPEKTLILPLGAEPYFLGKHNWVALSLLYIGSLNNRRIYETIEGVALFLKKYPNYINNISYTILGVGNKHDEKILNNTIEKNNLHNIVIMEGFKNYDELPLFLKNANIGVCYVPQLPEYDVQPSTKLFEYALSGLITIATKTSENKFYISNDNGILCDDNPKSFCDALELVYNSLPKYKISEEKIRNSLSDHSWEKITIEKLLPFIFR